jgi:hypothetical protein
MAGDARKWSEWDFSSLKDWEVEHCWSYEFTRLLPGLVRRVMDWRKTVPKRKGQHRFGAYLSHQGGRASPFIQIRDDLFLIPPGAYYLFPEWPAVPYLRIPPKVRFRRLKMLSEEETDWLEPRDSETPEDQTGRGKKKQRYAVEKGKAIGELHEIDPLPAQYRLNPVSRFKTEEQTFDLEWHDSAWKRFTDSLKENILRSNKLRAFRSSSEELALFRIPWHVPDKRLRAWLSKWLALNRPIPFRKQGTLGRSRPLQRRRDELERLRKYLIVQDAGTWQVKVGQTFLFRDRSRCNDCLNAVKKILTDLGSYPGCTT